MPHPGGGTQQETDFSETEMIDPDMNGSALVQNHNRLAM